MGFPSPLFITLPFLAVAVIPVVTIGNQNNFVYKKDGDIKILVAIVQFHAGNLEFLECTTNIQSVEYLGYIETIRFAVEKINQNPTILPGVSLGFEVLDTCHQPPTAVYRLSRYSNDSASGELPGVVGIIGSGRSSVTISVADYMLRYQVPIISTYATSESLSDKKRYPYIMRLVPPDTKQMTVLLQLAEDLGSSYVSVIFETSSYGLDAYLVVLNEVRQKPEICIAVTRPVSTLPTKDQIQSVVDSLQHLTNHVIIFIGFPSTVDPILNEMIARNISHNFLPIHADASGMSLHESTQSMMRHFAGSIATKLYSRTIPEYDEHFLNLTLNSRRDNPWFEHCLQYQGVCSMRNCSGNASFSSDPQYTPFEHASLPYDAVNVIAKAVHQWRESNCQNATGSYLQTCVNLTQIRDIMLSTALNGTSGELKFDSRGDLVGKYMFDQIQCSNQSCGLVRVMEWDGNTENFVILRPLKWYKQLDNTLLTAPNPPASICSLPCQPQHRKVFGVVTCCWHCKKCRENEITINNQSACLLCPDLTWPQPPLYDTCYTIPVEHVNINSLAGAPIAVWQVLNGGLAVAFFVFYIYQRKHKFKKLRPFSLV